MVRGNDMRFWKWTIGLMTAVLVVGCATYPVGYWVDSTRDDFKFKHDLSWCNDSANKNAHLTVPTTDDLPNLGLGGIILLPLLPGLIMNEQRWADVYTNTIKGCMEEKGYRWVNDPKGEKINYRKPKSIGPSQIDESQ
jgi:hypothetical protein